MHLSSVNNFQRAQTCEDNKVTVTCPVNQFINVVGATWRPSWPTECTPRSLDFPHGISSECKAHYVIAEIKPLCQGINTCTVSPAEQRFLKVCHGDGVDAGYLLEIDYTCTTKAIEYKPRPNSLRRRHRHSHGHDEHHYHHHHDHRHGGHRHADRYELPDDGYYNRGADPRWDNGNWAPARPAPYRQDGGRSGNSGYGAPPPYYHGGGQPQYAPPAYAPAYQPEAYGCVTYRILLRGQLLN